jgi:hypothetical protein
MKHLLLAKQAIAYASLPSFKGGSTAHRRATTLCTYVCADELERPAEMCGDGRIEKLLRQTDYNSFVKLPTLI